MDDLQETTTATITKPYDNVGGKLYPRVKMTFGVDGTANDVSASNPLPVTFGGTSPVSGTVSLQGTIPVSMSGSGTTAISGTVPISGTTSVAGTVPISGTVATSGTVFTSDTTLGAGEDLVNNRTVVEERFNPYFIGTAGTTTVKSVSGFIHTLTVTGGTAGAITGYDSTAGTSALKLFDFDSTNTPNTYTFDYSFANGLVVVTGSATKLSISAR